MLIDTPFARSRAHLRLCSEHLRIDRRPVARRKAILFAQLVVWRHAVVATAHNRGGDDVEARKMHWAKDEVCSSGGLRLAGATTPLTAQILNDDVVFGLGDLRSHAEHDLVDCEAADNVLRVPPILAQSQLKLGQCGGCSLRYLARHALLTAGKPATSVRNWHLSLLIRKSIAGGTIECGNRNAVVANECEMPGGRWRL